MNIPTTYPNSQTVAFSRIKSDLPQISAESIKKVLREAGIEPKRSILATSVVEEVVQFFVDFLVETQTWIENEFENIRSRNEYVSDVNRLKIVEAFVISTLEELETWFNITEEVRLEGFLTEVYRLTISKLTNLMIEELAFSDVRDSQIIKARGYASILERMRRDFLVGIDPKPFERLSASFDIVRDDITPGLVPTVEEKEVEEKYALMKEVVEREKPRLAKSTESRRDGGRRR